MLVKLINALPGFNCGNCNYQNCNEFAFALLNQKEKLSSCSILEQERFKENKVKLQKILSYGTESQCTKTISGVIDQYKADIVLEPLKGENSCREVLLPFTNLQLKKGNMVEYRPLGCPIVHYAKVLKTENQLITVHVIGPCQRLNTETNYINIGPCMVIGFEGRYHGKNIKVGETIRFLPNHCMMQKVHSGVVVNIEADKLLIEGIDLKVWHPPITHT